jgi:hypothetical protein
LALLVKVSVALTVPLTKGLKVMVKGTLWPAGMVTGSDSTLTLKTELLLVAAVTVTLAPLAVIVPDAVPLWPTTTLPRPRVVGAMESVPAGAFTVTVALAYLVGSATLVAVTVTVVIAVTAGALNNPVLLTVPAVADHVTAVLLVFVTWAENCWLPPETTVAVVGETETLTGPAEVVKV